jgi:hypothetical protein
MNETVAERMGALVQPGGEVASYKTNMSYKFNFYSRIRRFREIKGLEELAKWFPGDRPKYILTRGRYVGEIRSASEDRVQVVLVNSVGAEPWTLFSLCDEGCESAADVQKTSVPGVNTSGDTPGHVHLSR